MGTTISVGKSRTVTLKALIDRATGAVIPASSYELVGWAQSKDGGHLQKPSDSPAGATFKCVGPLTVVADYAPPQSALVQPIIQFNQPIRIGENVALMDANSTSLPSHGSAGIDMVLEWSEPF